MLTVGRASTASLVRLRSRRRLNCRALALLWKVELCFPHNKSHTFKSGEIMLTTHHHSHARWLGLRPSHRAPEQDRRSQITNTPGRAGGTQDSPRHELPSQADRQRAPPADTHAGCAPTNLHSDKTKLRPKYGCRRCGPDGLHHSHAFPAGG